MPNVLSSRDLVFRPDNMDETVPHTKLKYSINSPLKCRICLLSVYIHLYICVFLTVFGGKV